MAFKRDNKVKSNFTSVTISLASPEKILEESHGEVLKPETVNYRTYKPEREGLFCERIFGPVRDFECHCGKYKGIRYRGTVCDSCGVEVTEKKVRRERMGHIKLEVPVAHVWYFRSLPNKMAALLGINAKKLESIIYYERYVVMQRGVFENHPALQNADDNIIDVSVYTELTDSLYNVQPNNDLLEDSDPNKFICKTGAEAVEQLLIGLDLDKLSYELRDSANNETSTIRKNDALKRLHVVESFRSSKHINRPEWMVMKVLPVIPPDLRPLVPLDGGRFATSDLNDLYRRVIIRNNRLKRLYEIKAPEVIARNEKRMLQEAVDSLLDNSRKSSAVRTESNRPLKSLSDSLKGKQGRFRQNLLGKRVDYSARSVIVVGPELKMHECGIPKYMAAELYKPFVIRKLIERGIVKTVKSAKRIVDRKEPVIWDILEHVMKGHPVLLNRAPTLHRLGIQAFQPKMIEGKAIQLHPLSCTAFNADFDGDQMAVHLPLGNAAILEAQMLMLGSHNILNPANGAPITVPSQDMVLGLYYMTKIRPGDKGEGKTFYGPEEAIVAYNEGKISRHALIKVMVNDIKDGEPICHFVETSVGRLFVNEVVPKEVGYVNQILGKKQLRDIIGLVIKTCGVATTSKFLDDIKNLGYKMAFRGGLSFNLGDVITPEEKSSMIAEAQAQAEVIAMNYGMGVILGSERYQQMVDLWTAVNAQLSDLAIKCLKEDKQGFNSIYMMMDSGARGSKEQIRQLSGMRGLMAKPQKHGVEGGQNVIENPIVASLKEGLSALEYFISTHGARKGLADTALKTADAGYLTRRLVDVSQDVIITEEDCGTLRGLVTVKENDEPEAQQDFYARILGRVSVHDIADPYTGELIIRSGEEIREVAAERIAQLPINEVEIRSVLTCESKKGVCAKCYGRNLATNAMVQRGEVVGVIAAQSIGEPGTQLTLRTFHSGGVAINTATNNTFSTKFAGRISYEDLNSIHVTPEDGRDPYDVVVSRSAQLHIKDLNTGIVLVSNSIPHGAKLAVADGEQVEKGQVIYTFNPHNTEIIVEVPGTLKLEGLVEDVTYETITDSMTGHKDVNIIESKERNLVPRAVVLNLDGTPVKHYDLPVGARLLIREDGAKLNPGDVLAQIPKVVNTGGDITGGLPRVTELFEARNPNNPAVVSEVDGVVQVASEVKRGYREVTVTPRIGEVKKYKIPQGKQILVNNDDLVRAGMPLSQGAVSLTDLLEIKGPTAVQEYIVNEIQAVYKLQGVTINDKHFEVIVRQMMRKVEVLDPGDANFLEQQIVDKIDANEENDRLWGKHVVIDAGDSTVLHKGQMVTLRRLRDENSSLKRRDLRLVQTREARPATVRQILQGITRAALQTKSFMSAASFQETTKVLNDAAINAKRDTLEGLKENVICGNLIPAGTGLREYRNIVVMPRSEYERSVEALELAE